MRNKFLRAAALISLVGVTLTGCASVDQVAVKAGDNTWYNSQIEQASHELSDYFGEDVLRQNFGSTQMPRLQVVTMLAQEPAMVETARELGIDVSKQTLDSLLGKFRTQLGLKEYTGELSPAARQAAYAMMLGNRFATLGDRQQQLSMVYREALQANPYQVAKRYELDENGMNHYNVPTGVNFVIDDSAAQLLQQ